MAEVAVLAPPPETSRGGKCRTAEARGAGSRRCRALPERSERQAGRVESCRKKPRAERGESNVAGKSRATAEQPRAVAGSRRARGRKSPPSSGDGAAAACEEPERGAGAEAEPGAGPGPPCRTLTSSSGSSTRTSKVRGGGGGVRGRPGFGPPPPRVGRGLHWCATIGRGGGGRGLPVPFGGGSDLFAPPAPRIAVPPSAPRPHRGVVSWGGGGEWGGKGVGKGWERGWEGVGGGGWRGVGMAFAVQ